MNIDKPCYGKASCSTYDMARPNYTKQNLGIKKIARVQGNGGVAQDEVLTNEVAPKP